MYLNFNKCSSAPQPHVPHIFLLPRGLTLKSVHLVHHGPVRFSLDSTNTEKDFYDDVYFDAGSESYSDVYDVTK